MLICVDTSGSMNGGAEAVAKAVVLEAARIAHAQHRACHVFAFGGPEEIVELELGFEPAGAGAAGGLHRPGLSRRHRHLPAARAQPRPAGGLGWRQADLLIASDGEFGATAALAEAVERAKAVLGLQVQGVLIGDRETVGLLELVDEVFWCATGAASGLQGRLAGADKSLTAMYFPGACARRRTAPRRSMARPPRAVRRGKPEDPQ